MKLLKSPLILVCASVLGATALVAGSSLISQAQANDRVKAMLLAEVTAALTIENEVQALGHPEAAIAKYPVAKPLLPYFQKRIAKSAKLSLARASVPGPRYRDAKVDVKLVKFRSNQNTATLAVQEDRVNHFDAASVAAGAPQATESITDHIFNFAESNGAWELVSASNNDPTSVENAR
jgi:hypothetical protein